MIVLYLKDVDITTLPPDVAMFYRLAAFTNSTGGVHPRRMLFDTEQRIQTFLEAFPEIEPYIEKTKPTQYPDSCFAEPPPVTNRIPLPDDDDDPFAYMLSVIRGEQ